ncbi:pimeloyl-ACP methyl ester carboxylesterase [Bradyrhizobium sp. USDA 4011]
MALTRRTILQAAGALSLLSGRLAVPALAQPAPAGDIPPILFVHGNGDHAALWLTTLWRMESNGVPRERMAAINFADPLARTDDTVEQAGRSSTEDQRRELAEAVRELKQKSDAARIALVGNSRGGNAIRNYVKNGGGGDISHAVLCGTPNHGVYASDDGLGNEFNGRGPFLRGLNDGDSEVTVGTAFLTLRSDGLDKYAQADGRFIGKPGTPTNVTSEGPALKGATNLVLGAVDHRETAYHPRAFREIYMFIAGHEPSRIEITPETAVRLSGLVTGTPGGVPTNRPVPVATVDIYRVSAETGERIGGPLHSSQTGADGRWGPAQVDPSWPLEFVLTSPDAVTTHIYRSPFPRSSEIVHLRAARPLLPADAGAGAIVLMSRPRGYFGLPRDIVLLDRQGTGRCQIRRADRCGDDVAARRSRCRPSGGCDLQ